MKQPESINHLKPGKNLNKVVDDLFRDGVKTDVTLEELKDQLGLLRFINQMHIHGEVRFSFDETGMLYGMIRCLKEAIQEAEALEGKAQGFSDEVQLALDTA